ncbi:hypothetical protein M8J77_010053 [Diaphorina citri]|nr:hypothetical protein M8J77_010053 [Diaphorina citri]
MRPLYIEDKTTLSILRIKLFIIIIIIWCQVTRMFDVIEFEGGLLETTPTSWVIDGQCTSLQNLLKQLPLKTLNEVQSFDNLLMSEENVAALTEYLSFKSGDSLSHYLRNIMRECFLDVVLQEFSWCGTNGAKAQFKKLQIKSVIFASVMKNSSFHPKNNMEIEDPLRKYLAQAKHRIEMRKNKRALPTPRIE